MNFMANVRVENPIYLLILLAVFLVFVFLYLIALSPALGRTN